MASVKHSLGVVTFHDDDNRKVGQLPAKIYDLVAKDVRKVVSSECPNAYLDINIGTTEGRRWSLIIHVFWHKKGTEVLQELRGVKFRESVSWLLIGGK